MLNAKKLLSKVKDKVKDTAANARETVEKTQQELSQKIKEDLAPEAKKHITQIHEKSEKLIANDDSFKEHVADTLWELIIPGPIRFFKKKPPSQWYSLLFLVRDGVFVIEGDTATIRKNTPDIEATIKTIIKNSTQEIEEFMSIVNNSLKSNQPAKA